MTFRYLIDEPGPYEPVAAWREHLKKIKRLPQDDEGVRLAREIAERHIAKAAAARAESRQKRDGSTKAWSNAIRANHKYKYVPTRAATHCARSDFL